MSQSSQNHQNRPVKKNKGVRRTKASWDPLAEWYDGWMGQQGSKHHQLLLPELKSILDLQSGEKLLDLGCGQGFLADYVQGEKANYFGVDLSSKLIAIAKQRHPEATFAEADVTKLFGKHAANLTTDSQTKLEPNSFDVSLFFLSLQDMPNLEAALTTATQALKKQPSSRLVFVLTHPAFRIQRQSGWGYDEVRKLRYRRIDSYLSENQIPLKPYPDQSGVSVTYHRPLQSYMAALAKNNLAISDLREVSSESLLGDQTPRATRRAVREIPLFLMIKAQFFNL